MSEPFLAEVRIFGFNFAPRSWAQCDGQILPINQNQSLYSLLGTTYGGDGRTTFGLPELRGRTPIHVGTSGTAGSTNHALGQKSGVEDVTLAEPQIPSHKHKVQGTVTEANQSQPEGRMFAQSTVTGIANWSSAPGSGNTQSGFIQNTGGTQQHNNMQPYLAVNFCIALQGLFPSRN